jgi:hypothetical protein
MEVPLVRILFALLGSAALILGIPALFAQPGSLAGSVSVAFGSSSLAALLMRGARLGRRTIGGR